MNRKEKLIYSSPKLVQVGCVLLERSFLVGSVVDKMNQGGIQTVEQDVERKNFDSAGEEYNFKWE